MGLIAVADPDLQIRGGGHPNPKIRGGGLKKISSTLRASVWSKNNGEARAPQAFPLDPPLNCQPNLKIVSRSYRFSNNTRQWKKTEPPWVGPWVAGLLWEFKSNYRVSVKRRVAAGAEVGVYLFFKEYCFRVRVRRARVRVNPNPSHNPETAFFKKKDRHPTPRSTDTRNYQRVASCSSLKTHFHKLTKYSVLVKSS